MAKKRVKKADNDIYAQLASGSGCKVLNEEKPVKYYVDTGNFATNYICSGKFIKGGIAGGRITEIFGPESSSKSLFGTNVLYGCQKLGGYSVILDCENTMNEEFARNASHLDTSRVLIDNPPTLEAAFKKMHVVVETIRRLDPNKPIVIVYDSITVSPCQRELDEVKLPENYTAAEFKKIVGAKEQPGERAKICSRELRKLTSVLEKNDATLLVINQVRNKIGVLFGCVSGRSKVMLADGSWMKISKIVNQKLSVKVMSFNQNTNKIEPKRVIGWHKNGKLTNDQKFFKIRFKREFTHGVGTMTLTPNHKIFVSKDKCPVEISVSELKVGDRLVTLRPEWLNYEQWQLVYGSILGDGSIRRVDNSRISASLRFGHGASQEDYLLFKRSFLGDLAGKVSYSKTGCVNSDSRALPELCEFSDYRKNYLIPQKIVDHLDEFGLAIWYMDDGTYAGFHSKWGKGKSTIYAKKWNNLHVMLPVFERLGLQCTLNDKGYVFDSENTLKLHRKIARFVPPSMWYKLHESCHHLFDVDCVNLPKMKWGKSDGTVLSIEEFDHTVYPGDDYKYDLTVEDNSTYVVGGAVVHNSDETTGGGGRALPFYASCRLSTRAAKQIVKKVEKADKLEIPIGVNINLTNKKNKAYKPFLKTTGLQLFFDKGINPLTGLLSVLIIAERIKPKGSGYYEVLPEWAGKTDEEVKFKSSLERNDVPLQVLLDNPRLVDAENKEEILEYVSAFELAIEQSEAEDVVENKVSTSIDDVEDFDFEE